MIRISAATPSAFPPVPRMPISQKHPTRLIKLFSRACFFGMVFVAYRHALPGAT